jgi:hypothetical protein
VAARKLARLLFTQNDRELARTVETRRVIGVTEIRCATTLVKHSGNRRDTRIGNPLVTGWRPVAHAERLPRGVVEQAGARCGVAVTDLNDLGRRIRLEPQLAFEPAGQTRVHREEFVHLILIARPDETEVESVGFQRNQELVDDLHADHVRCAVLMAFDQRVELVHENDSAKRLFDQLVGLGTRFPDIVTAEIGSTDLPNFGVAHDPHAGIDLAQRFSGGRLTGAGWCHEQGSGGVTMKTQSQKWQNTQVLRRLFDTTSEMYPAGSLSAADLVFT